MAYAIFCDRNGKPWEEPKGYIPRWCAELELAEMYGAESVGVDFRKYVWFRRALTYLEAKNKSYQFEQKK